MAAKKKESPPQLHLFGPHPAPELSLERVRPLLSPEDAALAERLPDWLRFGTSSWTFPGWAGIVYAGAPTQKELVATGLAAYAANPLLRAVGIDRSHYAPLTSAELSGYAEGLPEGFLAISKIWDELTTCVFPRHPRFGARAGADNPLFLSADRFLSDILPAYRESFAAFTGPFVFEIPPMPRDRLPAPTAFTARLDALLSRLPRNFRYAFELRNHELLTPAYAEVLRAHGAAHVFNYWTAMPSLLEQMAVPGVLEAPFFVARLMLPPFSRNDVLEAELAPFDKIVTPQPAMRDDVSLLVRRAAGRDTFVLVNNKAEGSSPLTVRALASKVVRELFV